eukprot:CAMPEP_0184671206 /NCGR_PEP_ID=MMETSP0308-20130426/85362_1 /TAXON_ID=38269 /ORGANISM="Gloeochaete witrockiana, Strain SAG 46.84" /LENGTH=248 /DNA_ID=CAMNT_0027118289 /DNA_START=1149 /DNA_END=1896 /DNA_ORIENTATION=-
MILKTKLKLRHVNQDCSGTAQEMQAPAGECEGCPVVASVDHKVTEQGFWRNTREPGTITRASIPDNSKRLVKFPRSALRRMKCCGRKINTTIAVKAETVVRKNEKQRPGSNIVCGKLWSRIDAQGEETCGKERRQKRTRTSEEKGLVDRRKKTRISKEKVDIVDLRKKEQGMQAPAGGCEGCPVVASVEQKIAEQSSWRNIREPGTITRVVIPFQTNVDEEGPRRSRRTEWRCSVESEANVDTRIFVV